MEIVGSIIFSSSLCLFFIIGCLSLYLVERYINKSPSSRCRSDEPPPTYDDVAGNASLPKYCDL